MKKYLAIIMALVMALTMLAGCQQAAQPSEPGAAQEATTTAPEADQEPAEPVAKEIVWARAYESTSLDPAEAADDESNNIVSYTTEGLTRILNGEAVPGIAENWEISGDGLVYTFHLRESVWADGSALTAGDFVYSFFRLIDPAQGHSQAESGYSVKNARAYAEGTAEQSEVGFVADDDYTLTVTFESEGLENLYAMADNSLHPVQQAFVETVGAAYGSSMENIMGNGPMVITEWSHENQMVLEKNPNYWNADSINITKLTGMCNVSGDTAVEMMLTGQVDLAGFTDPTYYDQLYSAGFEGITYCNTDQFLHINQNGHNEEAGRFLSNVNFRLALSYALDRAAICNTVMLGQTPATRLIDPDAVGLNGKFVDEYPIDNGINPTADVTKAQEYLQMALTELGATIDDVPELSMLCYDSQGNLTKLQVIQDMFLTVLGVKCVIDPQPIQQMIAKVYSFDYDFWTGGVSIGTMDAGSPGGVLSYWDCNDPDALFGYNNVQYAELLDAAQQTTDLKTRYDAIAEMEKIFCNEIPSLLITWQTANVVYRPGIVITNIDMSYGADLAFADIAE